MIGEMVTILFNILLYTLYILITSIPFLCVVWFVCTIVLVIRGIENENSKNY